MQNPTEPVIPCRICGNTAATNSTLCPQCQRRYVLSPNAEIFNLEQPAVHPRLRCAARLLDLSIYTLLFSVLPIDYFHSVPILKLVSFMGLCILCEAFLLSTLGTTLGKLWFGIQIKNKDGSLLTFSQAAIRALKAWCLKSFVSDLNWYYWFKFRSLIAEGLDRWYKDRAFVVSQESLSLLRMVLGVVLILFCWIIIFFIRS